MASGASKAVRPVFSTPAQKYDPVDESAFRREVERAIEAVSETVTNLSSLPAHASTHESGGSDELALAANQLISGAFVAGTGWEIGRAHV